jgi:glycosyltransferase involved in cell wall biosynthesis
VLFFACFLVLGIQFVYLIMFLYQFLKKKGATPAPVTQPVSVIVCAHDEEQNLRELVPLLLAQEHTEFEVIIVEDRCNDGTFDYLMEAARQSPLLRIVRVQHLPEHIHGKKFGLTLGVKAARFDWVLFTDADCRPYTRHWASRMSEYFTPEAQIVLGFSAYQKSSGFLNSFIRFETFLTGIQYIAWARAGLPYMGVGRNLAYRKSLFLNSKGFNNHLDVIGGDDDLFVNRHATAQKTRVAIGEDVLVFSKPKTTAKEFYYQKLRHLSVGKKYRFSTQVVVGLFSLLWVVTWFGVLPVSIVASLFYWMLGALALRWLVMIPLFHIASRKLGDPFEAWKTPFLDFFYAFYYLVTGTVALVSKKVRWKI